MKLNFTWPFSRKNNYGDLCISHQSRQRHGDVNVAVVVENPEKLKDRN